MTQATERMTDDIGAAARTLANDAKDSAKAELAALRQKVEALMADRVTPAVSEAAGRAEDFAHGAAESIRHRADQFAGTVREQPFVAIGAAALAGVAIGLLIRR